VIGWMTLAGSFAKLGVEGQIDAWLVAAVYPEVPLEGCPVVVA